jgi:hypothetical protein
MEVRALVSEKKKHQGKKTFAEKNTPNSLAIFMITHRNHQTFSSFQMFDFIRGVAPKESSRM